MAKRRHQNTTRQRDASDIATDSEVLREFIKKPKPYVPIVTTPHLPTFDTRLYHPDRDLRPISEPRISSKQRIPEKGAVSVSGSSRTAVGNRRTGTLPATTQFTAPKQVAVCIRRKARREVLFAKQRTGKGARRSKRTRNQWSNVQC